MTDNLIFGSWGRAFRRIIKYEKPAKLEKSHKAHKPYGIVVGEDAAHPYCYLKVGFIHILVGILDEHKRLGLEFSYVKYQEDSHKIFLNSTAYYEYEGDTDTVTKTTEFNFSPEGGFVICTMDYVLDKKEINESPRKVDVSDLWYDYPEFGCYDELIYHNKFPKKLEEVDLSKIKYI